MTTQCERLERELLKGRRLSMLDMLNELHIGNHTGRVSDLRAKGYRIGCDDSKGYGVYFLESDPNRPESYLGMGDSYEHQD